MHINTYLSKQTTCLKYRHPSTVYVQHRNFEHTKDMPEIPLLICSMCTISFSLLWCHRVHCDCHQFAECVQHRSSIAVPPYALLTVIDLQYVCSINRISPVSITNRPSCLLDCSARISHPRLCSSVYVHLSCLMPHRYIRRLPVAM